MEWMNTMIRATVRESATFHRAQFTEESGAVYEAYKQARALVYEQVHPEINEGTLEAQLELCYLGISELFPDVDTVPVVAYMTDLEVPRFAALLESRPKKTKSSIEELKVLGFGFVELIEIMRRDDFESSRLYYNSPTEIPIL